eukprot:scaffold22381_cov118-Isochrysis_galbana.AAC.11
MPLCPDGTRSAPGGRRRARRVARRSLCGRDGVFYSTLTPRADLRPHSLKAYAGVRSTRNAAPVRGKGERSGERY